MFTGIIEATGTVEAIGRIPAPAGDAGWAGGAEVVRLVVTTELDVGALPIGASIAVDGVCLTVVERGSGRFAADLGPETLQVTTLGTRAPGDRVHLERPLRAGDPLGGHLVAGHVDGVGTVTARRERGSALELDIAAPTAIARYVALKGSIAVDGVSLTVNAVSGEVFSVTLIPHTLAVTKLGAVTQGTHVNLEADQIAKQIDRLMAPYLARRETSIDEGTLEGAPNPTAMDAARQSPATSTRSKC
jgi:riboflavin synthase